MRVLSVFCDESGDFGVLSHHSPRYILSLVLHDQSRSIAKDLDRFNQRLRDGDQYKLLPIHTAPLIRREERFAYMDGNSRKGSLEKSGNS